MTTDPAAVERLIAEAESALEGVTDGPWTEHQSVNHPNPYVCGAPQMYEFGEDKPVVAYIVGMNTKENRRFIAHARQAVPALIAALRAMQAERDRFEAALARACLVGGTTYLIERAEAAEAERDEARRRRDEWKAKAEGYDAVRLALREKVGAPWPPNMSRLMWAGIAADEKKRADDAEAKLAEVEKDRDIWREDSAAAWDRCELRRLAEREAEDRAEAAEATVAHVMRHSDNETDRANRAEATVATLTAQVEAMRGALGRIRELNMTAADENGHQWANSDLIEQEIVAALTTENQTNG